MAKKRLNDLTEYEFNLLKLVGFLLEFYPDAPETYDELKRKRKETRKVCSHAS